MAIYFLAAPYDKVEVGTKIENLGFKKNQGVSGYILDDNKDGFLINFTDSKDGRVQLQGKYVDDIMKNKKESAYYSRLEQIAKLFSPKRVVNAVVKDIFPELVSKK
jgi:hypothetical protein